MTTVWKGWSTSGSALHDCGDRTLKLIAEEIERRGFGSHAFRHFFTVQLVLRGVSPAELAK